MRRTAFLNKSALILSAAAVLLVGGGAAHAQYSDVIAGPGQSEAVVENALLVPVKIFINGQLVGTVKGSVKGTAGIERFVVQDGNNYIKAQTTEKSGATSKDFQFNTNSRRFLFRVTSPSINSVSIHRENVYPITTVKSGSSSSTASSSASRPASTSAASAPPQTDLERNKASMLGRMDAQLANAPPPASAPVASAPAASAAPAQSSAPSSSGYKPAEATTGGAVNIPAKSTGAKIPIAVYVVGNMTEGEKKVLGSKLLNELTKRSSFIGVERSEEFLAKIDAEHIKQRDETVDESKISALGKQFGARYICVATMAKAFGEVQLAARIIDIETALVVMSAEDSGSMNTMDDLDVLVFKVVRAFELK